MLVVAVCQITGVGKANGITAIAKPIVRRGTERSVDTPEVKCGDRIGDPQTIGGVSSRKNVATKIAV